MRIENADQFDAWVAEGQAPVHLVAIDGVPGVALVWEGEDGDWYGIRPVSEDDGSWESLPLEVRQTLAVRVDDFGTIGDDGAITPFEVLWPVSRVGTSDIRPGDIVEHTERDLDPRPVYAVGRTWLTLELLGRESPSLAISNYRVVRPVEERVR